MPYRRERTCCFSGHREIPSPHKEKMKTALRNVIESLIQKGVIYFGTGGALGFDTLASLAVLELKEKHPQIKLILVLACKDQTRGWSKEDVERYEWIKAHADKAVYTSNHYYSGCMHKRNRHLVNHSRYCVCYKIRADGGAAYTVDYALGKRCVVYNIVDLL